MSEVIISRRSSISGGHSNKILITDVIAMNTNWIVPNNVVNNTFDILAIGGGNSGYGTGSHYPRYGGCAGAVVKESLILNVGEIIPISIGKAGYGLYINSNSQIRHQAGSTFFGNYLSANGACGATGGGSGDSVKSTYGGGGGGSAYGAAGGYGGAYGGGGGGGIWTWSGRRAGGGGNGGTYGGGGGACCTNKFITNSDKDQYNYANGGHGGQYGGGGGSEGGTPGKGGEFGGNGGIRTRDAENGTNTIGWNNIPIELQGDGLGRALYGGGGGFGGSGGIRGQNGGGGGGGYGGNGGAGSTAGGGGGGGYGCNGGNANGTAGGGGGGYFSDGDDATDYGGGGGGYYNYAHGGTFNKPIHEGYGSGGNGLSGPNQGAFPKPGVVIIQYYLK